MGAVKRSEKQKEREIKSGLTVLWPSPSVRFHYPNLTLRHYSFLLNFLETRDFLVDLLHQVSLSLSLSLSLFVFAISSSFCYLSHESYRFSAIKVELWYLDLFSFHRLLLVVTFDLSLALCFNVFVKLCSADWLFFITDVLIDFFFFFLPLFCILSVSCTDLGFSELDHVWYSRRLIGAICSLITLINRPVLVLTDAGGFKKCSTECVINWFSSSLYSRSHSSTLGLLIYGVF